MATPGTPDWLASVREDILDPARPIVDPHHHLWEKPSVWGTYLLDDLWADTQSGHNVVKTVFVECRANYREDGPAHLRPLGETAFVAGVAAASAQAAGKARIAGIVAHADLTLGAQLDELLVQHEALGQGLFRGIRHAGPYDDTGALMNAGRRWPCPYGDEAFRAGVRRLGELGHTYDTWHFHHQNRAYLELARAAPGTTMVLDHFGTPLGVGPYASQRAEILAQWKQDIADIARCPNVVAKLGGMAMPDNGFGWHTRERPADSDEFVAAQREYYLHTIDCFGPERCMFESNYPVDRMSISYPVLWNAFKKIAASFSEAEKDALFHGTASRVYRL